MAFDQRHRYLISKIVEGFGLDETLVEKKFLVEKQHVNAFLEGSGPGALRWSYQVPEEKNKEGVWVPKGTKPVLQLSHQQGERLSGKCIFFVRINPKGINEKSLETDLAVGDIQGSALETFKALMSEVYLPVLQEQSNWGKMPNEHTKEFLAGASKMTCVLEEAANCLQGGVELKMPDEVYVGQIELRPGAFNQAANEPEVAQHMEDCLTDWCQQVEKLLNVENVIAAHEEPGPDTELEYWRNRMARFNSLTEQLKSKGCRVVLGVTGMMRSQANKHWKTLELKLSDAANEAKDNVRYLATLEKSFEVMYGGTPQQVLDSLRGLLQSIMTLYKIARFYGTPQRMTTMFCKITNQMILVCKNCILGPGKIWDQHKPQLIANMQLCVKLCETYKQQYILERDALQAEVPERPFEMDELAVFLKCELFGKRLIKLIDLFTTIHQFSSLEQHTHIAGLESVLKSFYVIVDDVKRKPYDLLDYSRNQFDRDYLEFNVNIHDLEISLQAFINNSFEHITSTEHAANLLAQFNAILQRDALKQELDSKHQVIFQHYARDLEAVQAQYEAHKHKPPVPRNAPPIAGNIMWSRQLLRRIEDPMQLFAQNKTLMAMKESKKVIKTYNRVAKALVEYETLWHQAWLKGMEQQRAGLNAPLLVRHPDTGQLLVNLDKDIMQLIREAKYLQLIGVHVPEAARTLLLQEEKFKYYFTQLSYAVHEYEEVMARVQPVFKPLLKPHLEDMEKKVAPGMFILTWASMNIDGYLHRFKQGLARLEELVRKLVDIVDNRVMANMAAVQNTLLVELPGDRSFTYEEFISAQAKFQKRQAEHLAVRNDEVARAIDDIISLVELSPRENTDVVIEPTEVELFRSYYSSQMYKAILAATQRSFSAMKRRLGSKTATGIFYMERPFFDVDVELKLPNITLNPTLDGIQDAVNSTAKAILQASRKLRCWGMLNGPATYYDLIACDKEVVRSVLLLTGSVEGIKQQVAEYLSNFDKYSFLWTQNLQEVRLSDITLWHNQGESSSELYPMH